MNSEQSTYTKNTSIKSVSWNIAGSLLNAASSMLLSILITRICGNDEAGIFAFAFAISQLFYTVGAFEIRPYQSTDINEKYSFKVYFSLRVLTCIVMLIASLGYVFVYGYSGEKAILIILLCLYRMTDAFSDVFQGFFQIKDRLDLSGQSLAFRVTISTIIFFVILAATKNLTISCIFMVIACIIWIVIFDFYYAKSFCNIHLCYNKDNIKKMYLLVRECLPLFLGAFLLMYIFNIPKVSIDKYMDDTIQNYFNIVFMPVSIINLFSIFLFRPLLTTLSESINSEKWAKFINIIIKLIIWVFILTIVCTIGAYFLGIPILSIIYSVDLSKYKFELLIMMVGGGFSALSTLLHYVITVMRKQKSLIVGYLITAIVGTIISDRLVIQSKITGASYVYFILMVILSTIFAITMIIFIKARDKH